MHHQKNGFRVAALVLGRDRRFYITKSSLDLCLDGGFLQKNISTNPPLLMSPKGLTSDVDKKVIEKFQGWKQNKVY